MYGRNRSDSKSKAVESIVIRGMLLLNALVVTVNLLALSVRPNTFSAVALVWAAIGLFWWYKMLNGKKKT